MRKKKIESPLNLRKIKIKNFIFALNKMNNPFAQFVAYYTIVRHLCFFFHSIIVFNRHHRTILQTERRNINRKETQ